MREQAARDFDRLVGTGYVERQLRPEQARAWRHAIAGVAHAHGQRIQSDYLNGTAWVIVMIVNAEPGRATRPAQGVGGTCNPGVYAPHLPRRQNVYASPGSRP